MFLLFIYYLLQGASIDTGPIPSINPHLLDTNHCTNLGHCQMIWNIVWSCLITIFSCTWVTIHPNIPCQKVQEANGCVQRWVWNPLLSFAEHHLPLFVWVLLVPEYIVSWAIRQFLRAQEIASDNRSESEILGYQ